MNRTRRTIAVRTSVVVALVVASSACSAHAPKESGSAPHADSRGGVGQTQSFASMLELVQARAPGVQVIQSGDAYALRIRGLTSPSGNNDPLIVIDGTPSSLPGTRSLDALNPNDVLKIEVLKDASSTAFYGMRGANGIILITTRKK